MTQVWKAYQNSLQRTVALKILRPEYADDPAEVLTFINEAKLIARVAHPNTVAIYDAVETAQFCFLVMEYIPGDSLFTSLEQTGRFTPARAVGIAIEIAESLSDAWTNWQLIHRNLTTKCIRLDSDETVKVNYMGQSLRLDPEALMAPPPDEIVGTPYFMAPEQARGQAVDCRADMYGLGCTLYHMLTGSLPFEEYDARTALHMQCEDFIIAPRAFNEHISVALQHVVEKLLMKDRDHRYANWPNVRKALKSAARGQIVIQRKRDPQRVSTIGKPTAGNPPRGSSAASGKKRIVIKKKTAAADPPSAGRRRIRVTKRR